jgi:hypothetical protein
MGFSTLRDTQNEMKGGIKRSTTSLADCSCKNSVPENRDETGEA